GQAAALALTTLDQADTVLGVLQQESKAFSLSREELDAGIPDAASGERLQASLERAAFSVDDARALAFARHAARKHKEFAVADTIRDRLKANGVVFEDTKTGVRVKLP